MITRTRSEPLTSAFSPSPLYHQVATVLRNRLGTTWKTGEMLPAEQELAKEFQVALGTMRRALLILVDEGFLVRRRGKGTVVQRAIFGAEQRRLSGSLTETVEFEQGVSMKLIACEQVIPSPEVRFLLKVPEGEKVTAVRRLLSLNRDPMAYTESFVPPPYNARLSKDEVSSRTIVSILRKKKIEITHAEQSISASVAGTQTARILKVALGFPVLLMTRLCFVSEHRPALYATGAYRGDRYCYEVTLSSSAN